VLGFRLVPAEPGMINYHKWRVPGFYYWAVLEVMLNRQCVQAEGMEVYQAIRSGRGGMMRCWVVWLPGGLRRGWVMTRW
jgi:hypothetical protein